MFIEKMNEKNVLASKSATLYAVKGPQGFYGGEGLGGSIWRETPASAYHFPGEKEASDFSKLASGTEPVKINSGMWNRGLQLRMYGLPVPQEILNWELELAALEHELELQIKAFVETVAIEFLTWEKTFIPEKKVWSGTPGRIKLEVATSNCYVHKLVAPYITLGTKANRYGVSDWDMDKKAIEMVKKNAFYQQELGGCPVMTGAVYVGGWSTWHELDPKGQLIAKRAI